MFCSVWAGTSLQNGWNLFGSQTALDREILRGAEHGGPFQSSNLRIRLSNLSGQEEKIPSSYDIFVCTESSGKLFPFTLFHVHSAGRNIEDSRFQLALRDLFLIHGFMALLVPAQNTTDVEAERAAWSQLPLEVSGIWGLTCLGKIPPANIPGTS